MKNQTPALSESYEVGMRALKNNIPELINKIKKKQRRELLQEANYIINKNKYVGHATFVWVSFWLIVILCSLFSCTPDEENNCDAELQEIEALQEEGFKNCNGSTTCIYKMTADYELRKKEILNKCR